RISIVIVIGCSYSFAEGNLINPGGMGNILECAVALIEKELRRAVFVANEQVEQSVIIDVHPNRGLGAGGDPQAAGEGHIGEGAIAIISEQRLALRRLPSATQHKNVGTAIVVVVSLDHVQPAQLVRQTGLGGLLGERAVSIVVEE